MNDEFRINDEKTTRRSDIEAIREEFLEQLKELKRKMNESNDDEFEISDIALPMGCFSGAGLKGLDEEDLEKLSELVAKLQMRKGEPSDEFKQMYTCHSYMDLTSDISSKVIELCELDMSDALNKGRWETRKAALLKAVEEVMLCRFDVMEHMRSLDVWKLGMVAEKNDDDGKEGSE